MEFTHLLSAKKIPLNKETGKENIRNSGVNVNLGLTYMIANELTAK